MQINKPHLQAGLENMPYLICLSDSVSLQVLIICTKSSKFAVYA